jgi:hypothetical protein
MGDFQEKSYSAQKKNIEKIKDSGQSSDHYLYYFENKDNFNLRVSYRTLQSLAPFLKKRSNWLTIGDYNGIEANFLYSNGQNATASDLSDAIISKVAEHGYIQDFKVVNVEKIQFEDNSYDYVSCKEAYHHFPRAYLGLYEMIRVSSKATILFEPIDIISSMPLILFIKNILDRINPNLINKIWKNRYSFESVGNYVFKISEREVEKMAMGMGLPCIAFKGINAFFTHKDYPEAREVPTNKKLWKKVTRKLDFLDFLNTLTLIPKNTLCCVIFKQMPDSEMMNDLKKNGFKVLVLPKNPYL